jgi:hypothetical protein
VKKKSNEINFSHLILNLCILFSACHQKNISVDEKKNQKKTGESKLSGIVEEGSLGEQLNYGSGIYLVVQKTGQKTYDDLEQLKMSLVVEGYERDSLFVVSGHKKAQEYLKKSSPGLPGSLRPIPEGFYSLGNAVPSQDKALAPMFYEIKPDPLPRSRFGIHLDTNRFQGSPGTAGCIGLPDKESLEKFQTWIATKKPASLFVDWKLGTFNSAPGKMLSLINGITDWVNLGVVGEEEQKKSGELNILGENKIIVDENAKEILN